MKYAIAIVAGVAMIIGFLKWSNRHDEQVQKASERYEECVKVEYGTTPGAWYLETGEYPTCDGE